MSTLFLIGNGFDVNCGMHTKYKDVYEGYIKTESLTDTIKKFKKDISSNIENWGDFEMAMAKYAESLNDESEFLECIRDFSEYMEKFLIEEVTSFKNKFNSNVISNAVVEEVRNSLSKFCFGISHNIDVIMNNRSANSIYNINFISFNYTDSFDFIYRRVIANTPYTANPIIHIHGVLQDDPVFGVDNCEQINVNYNLSRKAKRAFVKPIFNDEYDKQRVIEAKKLINNANVICVFGMSLGESDLSWRMALVEWLQENKSNQLFIYQYSLSNKNYRTVSEKIDIEEDEKENILKEWGIRDIDAIFDQIHIPCGRNIFNIKDVITVAEEKKRELEIEKKKLKERIEMGEKFINE